MNPYIKKYIKRALILPVKKFHRLGTGGTISARYCYSVWLRHLKVLNQVTDKIFIPKSLAEIGPGDSIGIGLSAMLCGVDKYWGFDQLPHAFNERNIGILDELVELFNKREPIPNEAEFPTVKPYLEDYSFPSHILTDEILDQTLNLNRISKIKKAIKGEPVDGVSILYIVPWESAEFSFDEPLDMIISQAVLEHIIKIENAVNIMYQSLKQGGFMSHQIDYKAHEISRIWNYHWKYNDLVWWLAMQGREYPMNRLPHSEFVLLFKSKGFEIINKKSIHNENSLKQKYLKGRFKKFPESDYVTSGALIQMKK